MSCCFTFLSPRLMHLTIPVLQRSCRDATTLTSGHQAFPNIPDHQFKTRCRGQQGLRSLEAKRVFLRRAFIHMGRASLQTCHAVLRAVKGRLECSIGGNKPGVSSWTHPSNGQERSRSTSFVKLRVVPPHVEWVGPGVNPVCPLLAMLHCLLPKSGHGGHTNRSTWPKLIFHEPGDQIRRQNDWQPPQIKLQALAL